MEALKKKVREIGMPRIIIVAFIIVILIAAMIQKQDMATLITDSLVRVGQNMLLALAMLPCMLVGAGLNMGLSIGIVCGIVGGLLSVQFGLTSWIGFFVAAGLAILFGCLGGYIYTVKC